MKGYMLILVSALFIIPENCLAASESSDGVASAVQLMKESCARGESLNIEGNGEGGVRLTRVDTDGILAFSKEEVRELIASANSQIRSEKNSEIRLCMQPLVQKILTAVAVSASKANPQESLPVKQWIPLDMPMPILDGNPLLTLAKVYESGRDEVIDLVIEIPHRSPYLIKLYQSPYPNRKNFGTFKYRDTIYKIVADYIDLQEQRAQVSVINYKKAM